MNLFRPITQTVMAVQWDGTNEDEVREVIGAHRSLPPHGYWVVLRGNGQVAAYSPGDFASNYEPVLQL